MQIFYPKPPSDPSIPQWWVLSMVTDPRLKSFSMLLRLGPISIHYRKNDPDISPAIHSSEWQYSRPSRFYVIRLNNSDRMNPGRTAKIFRMICVDCNHEYPCPPNFDTDVKCDCTLARKNSVVLWWGRNKRVEPSGVLYKNSREFKL